MVFFAVTAFVTYMKNARVFDPSSEVARHFSPGTRFLIPHAFFSGIALVMGALQFSNRLRARFLALHRRLGYVYVVCVVVGAPMAIPLSVKIGTPSLVAASVVQTFGWVACTLIALYCIRNGNIQQHRRWMLRGYPFAVVFTVTRVIIPIPPILRSGVVGTEIVVWCTIAAAAFLPTLVLEWPALRRARPSAPRASATAQAATAVQ
ncbi:MAG TPA: DUF2306 domain-containing protein [Terriglobales bacterium]|nr:DUF2306 domain-containing protein [Terriglobales bacterium]